MAKQKSVLIVGGGVIGLCCAYYMSKRGHQVTVLERGGPDRDCCSLGNAGMIVPSHFVPLAAPGMVALGLRMMLNPESPFCIRPRCNWDLLNWAWKFYRSANADHVSRSAPLLRDLNLASRRCFEELDDQDGLDFGLVKKGLLLLCKSQHVFNEEAESAERSEKLGIPAQVLTSEQTAKLEPNIRMDIVGGVYFPLDCHFSPERFFKNLTNALKRDGVQFVWSNEATGWHVSGKRIEAVQTRQSEFIADEYILAGGAWSPEIVRALKLNLPMQAGQGYSITLQSPKQLPQICSILTEARIAVTPMDGALRFAGTLEIAGLKQSVNQRRVDGIVKAIPSYFPEFVTEDFRNIPVWTGLRPCSPDGLPYCGRFNRYANLTAATGHAMMGMSLGPITGKLISEIVSDEKPSIDVGALNPDRFN